MSDFATTFSVRQHEAWRTSEDHGFHESSQDRDPFVKVCLVHAELGELTEALRVKGWGEVRSEKIPDFTLAEEECADVVIRLMDFCEMFGLDLGGAIEAKMKYNDGRPHKHGKEV